MSNLFNYNKCANHTTKIHALVKNYLDKNWNLSNEEFITVTFDVAVILLSQIEAMLDEDAKVEFFDSIKGEVMELTKRMNGIIEENQNESA